MTHPVLQFEELRKNAMNTGDVESFRELFDPAMIYRHSSGVVDSDLAPSWFGLEVTSDSWSAY